MVKLPAGVNEAVTPCSDGYTVYIDIDLPDHKIEKVLKHVIQHIDNNDFDKNDVQTIEIDSHKEAI
jgi:hypothetical protein